MRGGEGREAVAELTPGAWAKVSEKKLIVKVLI